MKKVIPIFLFIFIFCLSLNAQENKDLVFEYSFSYGSICCPKDLKWDSEGIEDTIKKFENDNNILMKGTYNIITGKEGESTYYFSFFGWSDDMKNKFLAKRGDLSKISHYTNKKKTLDSLKKSYSENLIKKIN